MNANEDLKKLMPYGIAYAVIFLLLPASALLIRSATWVDFMILGLNPLACIILSCIYAYKNDFDWMYIVVAPAIFLISTSIYYSSNMVVYVIFYAGFCLMGVAFGKWRRDLKKRKDSLYRKIKH